jgi:hypothetical protein
VAKITVQKLKYGASGKDALVYFIPGYGVSKEMTDVFDCIEEGIATRGTSVELQGQKMGRIGTLAEKALDPAANIKTFRPFAEALDAIP